MSLLMNLPRGKYLLKERLFSMSSKCFLESIDGKTLFYATWSGKEAKVYSTQGAEALSIQLRESIEKYTPDKSTSPKSAVFDIYDSAGKSYLGTMVRDAVYKEYFEYGWTIKDTEDKVIGTIREGSGGPGFISKFYVGEIEGDKVCTFSRRFNPLKLMVDLDFSTDSEKVLDMRLGIAAAVLLFTIGTPPRSDGSGNGNGNGNGNGGNGD